MAQHHNNDWSNFPGDDLTTWRTRTLQFLCAALQLRKGLDQTDQTELATRAFAELAKRSA